MSRKHASSRDLGTRIRGLPTPSNYTPTASNSDPFGSNDIAGHLKGIDGALVGGGGGSAYIKWVRDGQTIQEVIDSIVDASADKPYLVMVPPGHEDETWNPKRHITVQQNRDEILATIGRQYSLHRKNPPYETIYDFEDATDWTIEGGTPLLEDSTDHVFKTKSLKVTFDENAHIHLSGPWDLTGRDSEIWVKVEDWDKVDRLVLYYRNEAPLVIDPYYLDTRLPRVNGEWFRLPLARHMEAGFNYAQTDTIRILGEPAAGQNMVVYFDSLRCVKTLPFPLVILRFDDGPSGHFEYVAKVLDEYDYKGMFGIVTQWIGNAGVLTAEQVKIMNKKGHDMVSHTHTHPNLSTKTCAEGAYELLASKRLLEEWGCERGARFFVLPFGLNDSILPCQRDFLKQHYRMLFYNMAETIPWLFEPFNMYNVSCHQHDTAAARAEIDTMLAAGGGCVVMMWHTVGPGGNTTEAEFREVIDYIHTKGCFVVTPSEIYDNFGPQEHAPAKPLLNDLVTAKSSSGTVHRYQQGLFLLDTGVSGIAITLPDATENAGLWYEFKKINADASAVTIWTAGGGQHIEGVNSNTEMDAQNDSMKLRCDGANWYIVHKNIAP